jgi:hypothetical protein
VKQFIHNVGLVDRPTPVPPPPVDTDTRHFLEDFEMRRAREAAPASAPRAPEPRAAEWVRLERQSNWGGFKFAIPRKLVVASFEPATTRKLAPVISSEGPNGLPDRCYVAPPAEDYKSREQRVLTFTDGDPIRVRWPDGSITDEVIKHEKFDGSDDDHGKTTYFTYEVAGFVVETHGLKHWLPLDGGDSRRTGSLDALIEVWL